MAVIRGSAVLIQLSAVTSSTVESECKSTRTLAYDHAYGSTAKSQIVHGFGAIVAYGPDHFDDTQNNNFSYFSNEQNTMPLVCCFWKISTFGLTYFHEFAIAYLVNSES